ncbi:pyrroloquinoline quinone precursor peptide PqqA [Bombella apis]|uniref:pyrroloquinoline quinone precursor peptide PqqA n=1 Tax=Bombella apis TaxID=1785988 RepID=UPI0030B81DF7
MACPSTASVPARKTPPLPAEARCHPTAWPEYRQARAASHVSSGISDCFCSILPWQVRFLSGTRPVLTIKRSPIMAWNTPKVTEIPLGGEINSYVCGEKK